MAAQRRWLWIPVMLVAMGGLLAGTGCDGDFEEMFEDLDISIGGFGGYDRYDGCYDCGGGGYYVVEDVWYDEWWW